MNQPTQLPTVNLLLYIWIPVIATIGGALVTGIILLINNLINKRSEERKHLNQIMLNAALENWKGAIDFAKLQGGAIVPFEAHLIYVMKLTNVLFNKNITKGNISEKLKEVREVCDEVEKFIESSEKKEG